jgi:hypothetical protein
MNYPHLQKLAAQFNSGWPMPTANNYSRLQPLTNNNYNPLKPQRQPTQPGTQSAIQIPSAAGTQLSQGITHGALNTTKTRSLA